MENKPVIALMYDFDKTLCTRDMQEYGFVNKVGMTTEKFWEDSNGLAKREKMDKILAYMRTMLCKSKAEQKSIRRNDFVGLGKDLEFFPGVKEWFESMNFLGKDLGMDIQHYIISSGLKEIIEGCEIYNNGKTFKEIFACEFLYDENGVACWPKNAINYTTKTQFLFRINKGLLDVSEDDELNKYTPEDDRPVPFRNMIYIGDGLTDVPCMKLVKVNGGCAVAVYNNGDKPIAQNLIREDRVDYIAPADYSENGELYKIVSDIICKMAMVDSLKRKSNQQRKEAMIIEQ